MSKQLTPELRFPEFDGDWTTKSLGNPEVATFFKGKGISKNDIVEDGETPCIRYGELYTEYNEVIDEVKSSTDVPEDELVLSEEFDVIIPASGETVIDIATASCVLKSDIALGGDLNIIRPNTLNGVFLAYYLNNAKKRNIARLAQGISVIHLYKNHLKSLSLNIPEPDEQQKIANFLKAIDKRIKLLKTKKEALEDYKTSIMQKLFSQEIRFKQEDGRDFPEWEELTFSDLVKINQGLQIPISERYTEHIPNSYFYITNEFLKDTNDKNYYIKEPPQSVICSREDVLMTRTGNTGMVVTNVEGVFHNNFFKIDYNESLNKDFLVYFLNSFNTQKRIKRLAGTSTIPDLNHSDFYKIEINLPVFEEQAKISRFLIKIDSRIEILIDNIFDLKAFKDSLLQKMFV
ncbi:restriction endonuclease subunit S [Maribacter sp. MJ134]|uniref:restriction endonuclease subunit S n=1 Tax=Maribacter sp. MJ134 TaxID=2496865 RepID=UPI000F82188E|nr:restriction endonuclease subunit S [Maribacter sp. MJ134]AZQ59322.1 restriction endonuclease subunit S [Maribacter sp. MJ134]